MHGGVWLLFPSNMAFLFVGEQFLGAWSSTCRSTHTTSAFRLSRVVRLLLVEGGSCRNKCENCLRGGHFQKSSAQCPQPKQIKEKPWSSSDQQGRAVESLCPRRTLPCFSFTVEQSRGKSELQ